MKSAIALLSLSFILGCIYITQPSPNGDNSFTPNGDDAPTSCTRTWSDCNGDRCGPPYRCYEDGEIRNDPEGDTGETCGGPSDCENCSTGPWNALPCGTYTWEIGECHCVD